MAGNERKKRSGKRITGSVEPFQVKPLMDSFSAVFSSKNAVIENNLSIFRENAKDAVALRMRYPADKFNKIDGISVGSQEIVKKILGSSYSSVDLGFISCTLDYFSGRKTPSFDLNYSCPSCKFRDEDKAFASACADCKKFYKTYVKKIVNKLNENPWSNLNKKQIEDWRVQYQAIFSSIEFVTEYIVNLTEKNLPTSISKNVFEEALVLDPTLINHYNYNLEKEVFFLKRKRNNAYSSVSQECASFIFCSTKK